MARKGIKPADREEMELRSSIACQNNWQSRWILGACREREDGSQCSGGFGGILPQDGLLSSSQRWQQHAPVLKIPVFLVLGHLWTLKANKNLRSSSSQYSRRETNFSFDTARGSWSWGTSKARVLASIIPHRQAVETAATLSFTYNGILNFLRSWTHHFFMTMSYLWGDVKNTILLRRPRAHSWKKSIDKSIVWIFTSFIPNFVNFLQINLINILEVKLTRKYWNY